MNDAVLVRANGSIFSSKGSVRFYSFSFKLVTRNVFNQRRTGKAKICKHLKSLIHVIKLRIQVHVHGSVGEDGDFMMKIDSQINYSTMKNTDKK